MLIKQLVFSLPPPRLSLSLIRLQIPFLFVASSELRPLLGEYSSHFKLSRRAVKKKQPTIKSPQKNRQRVIGVRGHHFRNADKV